VGIFSGCSIHSLCAISFSCRVLERVEREASSGACGGKIIIENNILLKIIKNNNNYY